jgi:hypothetical protein
MREQAKTGYERCRRSRVLPAAAVGLTLALGPFCAGALAASAPQVTTGGTSGVGYSGGTLEGTVNPEGKATSYYFEYGTSSSYGTQTSALEAGNGTDAITVSEAITGLQAGKEYRYRIVGSSEAGKSYGSERHFTTASIPLSLTISGSPNPVIFGSPFFVQGSLSGTGAGGREIVLQSNPYPYTRGFQTVGNPELTSSSGSFSFPYVGLLENAELRVQTVGSPTVTSGTVLEGVAVRVGLHIVRAARRGYFKVYGTVSPAEVGALVGFEQLRPGNRYVNVNGTVVRRGSSATSVFSRTVRLRGNTLYRALVLVSDPAHASIESASVRAP